MLTDQDRAILAFEGRWIDQPRGMELAILHEFGFHRARYYQLPSRVIEDPTALAEQPQLVYRLRQRQAKRLNTRNGRLIRKDW